MPISLKIEVLKNHKVNEEKRQISENQKHVLPRFTRTSSQTHTERDTVQEEEKKGTGREKNGSRSN